MSRPSVRIAGAVALAAFSLSLLPAFGQQQVPTASSPVPAAPAPTTAPTFPKPDPSFFTATAPTADEVNAFLQTSWGYDPRRVWQVQAILKTHVAGLSKVVVLVGDKTGAQKVSALEFFALPDGKHIIAGNEVLPFGANPYTDDRAELQAKADGPYRGSPSKELELVEFADFQCPHCKEAQANMDKLVADFPSARVVFQNYPLARIHPEAVRAATYGVCVNKMGGSNAFFQYASAVFEGQEGLATPDGATLTLNSAVTKAALDPAKVAACAATPAAGADVESSVDLARDLNVNQTPTLMVNGRQVPLGGVPYTTIKSIVEYQAKLDGVTLETPTTPAAAPTSK
ncbi:MAG TPA: thioredoxin domain-containing protein [Terracidiphilus sp.]|nr:thioredoxin domain-containing protein [Terracidiphilus sp.]